MPESQTIPSDPKAALRTLRVIWGAIVLSPLLMAGILLAFASNAAGVAPDLRSIFIYTAVAMLLVLTPLGYFIRNQTYKAHWRGDAITPAGYVTGNIVLLGMMEAVADVAVIFAFIVGTVLPFAYVAGAAILVMLINFPTGRPMEPTEPIVGERSGP